MYKLLFLFICIICLSEASISAMFEGGVEKTGVGTNSVILDAQTNIPIENVKISLPKHNFTTYTNSNGAFFLNTKIDAPTILSIEKEGYRPYSITIDKTNLKNPLIISIEKSSLDDIIITSGWFHLGDNSFSPNSANCNEFHEKANGSFYSQSFTLNSKNLSARHILIIGSIIGIDSLLAQKMGQNKVKVAYASPPEIFLNGIKIANIELNGDSQRFELPKNLVRKGVENEITIKTGRNMSQTSHIDYDDIEFMNLSIIAENP